ncbi:allantoicase [Uliginosibacterium sp. 31-16]|uniref:allantoicase n=1 Tax=Uliginosibacterium sp. 31-16 TaxID=3068315 RepID=UPI00273D2959|nr:allantoicase [Uliginosibacterium sp. 31-16]MDP5238311.1 allantoicase [Uliginosibacterium sp. 31-16]
MALVTLDLDAPAFARRSTNLADPRLGAATVACSDDFFADMQRMLDPAEPVFIPGKYDTHGKWMDGWESRRKRGPGNDWCIVKLARAGQIYGVEIDTRHFTGNYPPGASLEACCSEADIPGADSEWAPLLPAMPLAGNSRHYHAIDNSQAWTHVRLSIYPDGGIARLRVYGRPSVDFSRHGAEVDFAAAINGASIVAANNEHFGLANSLLLPGRGANMGDGWETRRRREPGNDWVIIALAAPALIERVEVDTAHFKGNYPDSCSLQAARMSGGTEQSLITQSMFWPELLAPQKLHMDAEHHFASIAMGPITHVRFNIFPDGGVSRLRLFGKAAT